MRVLHVNEFGSRRGGTESYIAEVTAALSESRHESHLIYLAPDDQGGLIDAATHAPLVDWPASIEQVTTVIEQVIAKFQPDVAYIHCVYHPDLVRWLAQRLPVVAYAHAPYLACPGSAQYLRRSAAVCPHSAGLICLVNAQLEKCCWGRDPLKHIRMLQKVKEFVSAYHGVTTVLVGSQFMQHLLQHAGMPADKLHRLAPVLIHEARPEPTFKAETRTVLYAGRIIPEKGLRQLIEALATIKSEWRLVVAGDGEDRGECEALSSRLGVARNVSFVGWLSEHELHAQYRECACVAFPSLWPEPFGRIGPEAFIHSRPIVAYATGGIPDWLEDGVTGYLVPAGDRTTLGRQVESLLNAPELRQKMGQRAYEKAVTSWGATSHVVELLQIFKSVTQKVA